jgi:spore cortex biosynthesis protein YabQ
VNVTLAEQLRGFYLSLGMGVFLGAVYDIFRLIRIFWNPPKRQLFFLDMLCMLLLGIFSYLLFLAVSSGSLRLYVILGECIGFCVYVWTVGRITERIAGGILHILRRFLWRPLQGILSFFGKKIEWLTNKVYISIKQNQKHTKKP